jgi:hypothetical protein
MPLGSRQDFADARYSGVIVPFLSDHIEYILQVCSVWVYTGGFDVYAYIHVPCLSCRTPIRWVLTLLSLG